MVAPVLPRKENTASSSMNWKKKTPVSLDRITVKRHAYITISLAGVGTGVVSESASD